MNLTGLTTIFVKDILTERGPFRVYSTTISHKDEDGKYTNATIKVRFAKDLEDGLKTLKPDYCYQMELKSAWLDCRAYTNKEEKDSREIFIFINSALVKSKTKLSNSNELPNLMK